MPVGDVRGASSVAHKKLTHDAVSIHGWAEELKVCMLNIVPFFFDIAKIVSRLDYISLSHLLDIILLRESRHLGAIPLQYSSECNIPFLFFIPS